MTPPKLSDATEPSVYDGLSEVDRLRLKLREAQAKLNQLARLQAAAWQKEQDRHAEQEEADRERRRTPW